MNGIRTILAVMRKELIMLVRYPTWVIQMVIWPLIFPLIYILSSLGFAGPDGVGLKQFAVNVGTTNYMGFIMVGTMAWQWVNISMWSFGTYLRQEQMLGTLESNWLCPINKFHLLVGAALINILSSTFVVVISVLEYKSVYNVTFTGNPLSWIVMFLIMIPGVYGLGILFASLVFWAKEANAAVQIVRGIMMMLCGITFPIAIIPHWMRNISRLIPFTYGISGAREIMVNGGTLSSASHDIIICLAEGIILLVLGRIAFMYTERKVKNYGALGRF